MDKGKDINNQLYKYLSPDLYCYVHNYIVDLKMQIDQLTNNWNELEEFIQKELDNNVDGVKSFGGYQCKIILDKMKEIKEGKK